MKTLPKSLIRSLLLPLLVLAAPWSTSPAGDFTDSVVAHVEHPEWFKDSFLDLGEDIAAAVNEGKTGLMVLFTTEGCSYCAMFVQKSLGDPALAALVREHFDAIGLEIFSDAEMTDPSGTPMRVKEFALAEGAEFAPTLAFYGADGSRIFRAVGYQSPERFHKILDYVSGGIYRSETFRDYSDRRTATTEPAATYAELREDALFAAPPYALDRSRLPADRPLVVLFEQTGCEECEHLHREVLALPEVRDLLGKFEVVRLDAADEQTPVLTPDGSRVTPASWFAQTGFSRLPALLFFDEHGREVLRTDALVLRQRMINSCLFVLERAYEKGWTYQRLARSKGLERRQEQP